MIQPKLLKILHFVIEKTLRYNKSFGDSII